VVRSADALQSYAAASPRQKALAGFAALVTQAPWEVRHEDLQRLRDVGLSDEGLVQAVTIAAFFNYVTRVADSTGIEFDYVSPLPRLAVNREQEPLPRPERSLWRRASTPPRLNLALRPATRDALERWRSYLFDRPGVLTDSQRRLLASEAASRLCDLEAAEALAASPRDALDAALVAFSAKLSLTPWRMNPGDLDGLRAYGWTDSQLLAAISTVALQNLLSRIRLALADSR